MKIAFHGAARTTTGSMHLIETDRQCILLDCGLYQGRRAEAFERNAHLPFDPESITHVILSHAHIDHSGNLPTLVKNGYAGEINCTTATRDLATLMLRDSAHIQEQDAAYLNQKTSRRGLPKSSRCTRRRTPRTRSNTLSDTRTIRNLVSMAVGA